MGTEVLREDSGKGAWPGAESATPERIKAESRERSWLSVPGKKPFVYDLRSSILPARGPGQYAVGPHPKLIVVM